MDTNYNVVLHPSKLTKLSNLSEEDYNGLKVLHPSKLTKLSNASPI